MEYKEKFYVIIQEEKFESNNKLIKYLEKGYALKSELLKCFIESAKYEEVKKFKTLNGAKNILNYINTKTNLSYTYKIFEIIQDFRVIKKIS
jgi:hypothetical protein